MFLRVSVYTNFIFLTFELGACYERAYHYTLLSPNGHALFNTFLSQVSNDLFYTYPDPLVVEFLFKQ